MAKRAIDSNNNSKIFQSGIRCVFVCRKRIRKRSEQRAGKDTEASYAASSFPGRGNGFTLIESLLVLLIVVLLAGTGSSHIGTGSSLKLFMQMMEARCLNTQQQAFASKRRTEVVIGEHEAWFDGSPVSYPDDIACQPISFHYTPDGNISKGGTLRCQNGSLEGRIVFQIAAGRMRMELDSDWN